MFLIVKIKVLSVIFFNIVYIIYRIIMNLIFDIIKYCLPAILVILTAWLLIKNFIKNSENQRKSELMMKGHEIMLPLRLQAYERIVLFLERISIDSLLMRNNQPGMNSRQLHTELLSAIRNEYEHNLSQQVYMSGQAWEMVKNARAQMIKIINTAAEKVNPTLPAIELNKQILENIGEYSKSPTQTAIDFIKTEVHNFF
jgi:hypothetical protein